MDDYRIRYTDGKEKENTRQLWERAFLEDSKEFIDYYYDNKIKDNQVIIKSLQDLPVSMVQLNPYEVWAKNRIWDVNYIVGVATDSSQRRRGHMRELLCRVLHDMYGQRQPFTYLMPEREAIYLPFDFTYVYRQEQNTFKDCPELVWQQAVEADLEVIRQFTDAWINGRYDLYTVRTAASMKRLWRELRSEDGGIELAFLDKELVGLRCFWGRETRYYRNVYGPDRLIQVTGAPKPAIMARIIHLPSFLEVITADRDTVLPMHITDAILPENDGWFLWHLNREKSWLERQDKPEEEEQRQWMAFTIAQLAAWLFGYEAADSVSQRVGFGQQEIGLVKTFTAILLDEVV